LESPNSPLKQQVVFKDNDNDGDDSSSIHFNIEEQLFDFKQAFLPEIREIMKKKIEKA
jgi:hypothetical protein